jgi:hypothetical protein
LQRRQRAAQLVQGRGQGYKVGQLGWSRAGVLVGSCMAPQDSAEPWVLSCLPRVKSGKSSLSQKSTATFLLVKCHRIPSTPRASQGQSRHHYRPWPWRRVQSPGDPPHPGVSLFFSFRRFCPRPQLESSRFPVSARAESLRREVIPQCWPRGGPP